MNIIANNVANMNTPGYRAQNLIFSEYISDPRGQKDPLSFVFDHGQYQVNEPGTLDYTGNPLDAAIAGPGFFGVIAPDGEVAYTRGGNFQLGPDGTLVTGAGMQVADANGSPITIPDSSTEINIDETGTVSNQDGSIGQIMVVEFENLQNLDPFGNNMYRTDAAAVPAENSIVKQGVVEGSNVQPVIEMTRMIDTLRTYQSVQNVLKTENDRLRGVIDRLTRTA